MSIRLSDSIRRLLRWKVVGWVIAVVVGIWLGMIPLHHFVPAYLAICIWTALGIGSWLTSQPLRKARPTQKQLSGTNRKKFIIKFRIMRLGVPFGLLVLAGVCLYYTFLEQRYLELSQFNGVLFPANDSDPPGTCGYANWPIPPTALKMYFGEQTVAGYGNDIRIFEISNPDEGEDPILLGIDRSNDGTVSLHANITGSDGKVVAHIDRNTFEVRRNALIDPFSSPRIDKSTIQITDEYGNKLRVRLINKHSVFFNGNLYMHGGSHIEIDNDGIRLFPGGGDYSGKCVTRLR